MPKFTPVSGNLSGHLLARHVQLDVQPDDLLLHESKVSLISEELRVCMPPDLFWIMLFFSFGIILGLQLAQEVVASWHGIPMWIGCWDLGWEWKPLRIDGNFIIILYRAALKGSSKVV